MLHNIFSYIGRRTLYFAEEVGIYVTLFRKTVLSFARIPKELHNIFLQMEEIGFNSMPVVLITGMFTGMVLALQTYAGFARFNATSFVGPVVALSMCRELGPVLTAFVVSGRAGSAMAAELGTMRVTEQIDALYTLSTDPVDFLILPRFLSGIVMLPVLTIISDLIGILGGFYVAVNLFGENSVMYMDTTFKYLLMGDVLKGLAKAFVFGGIIAIVSCKEGFFTSGGAEGVGKATTKSVVISYMAILISDYFLTSLMF
jgi:phospholipid/cholesterol/gamma-HCH transport system permease protein